MVNCKNKLAHFHILTEKINSIDIFEVMKLIVFIACLNQSCNCGFVDLYLYGQQYYSSGRMLVKLAEAIGRLVLAGREMTRLAGFTARVTELMSVLSDINQGHYQRTMLKETDITGQFV